MPRKSNTGSAAARLARRRAASAFEELDNEMKKERKFSDVATQGGGSGGTRKASLPSGGSAKTDTVSFQGKNSRTNVIFGPDGKVKTETSGNAIKANNSNGTLSDSLMTNARERSRQRGRLRALGSAASAGEKAKSDSLSSAGKSLRARAVNRAKARRGK
jgi:hypothetical protein